MNGTDHPWYGINAATGFETPEDMVLNALEWLESYLRDTPHYNSPAAANARAVLRATMHSDCPQSHDGRHHADTSMEEGPHHCFHCGTNLRNPTTPEPKP